MKNIVFLLLLLFSFTGYGAPSYGQEFNDSQKSYLNSENLLVNPGFESGVTGWTTTGTASSESVNVIKGRKSFKIVLANQILTTTQDSTRYATQFADGVQGLLTVRIKTLVSGLRVCARQAGVINTSLCVSVPSNGKWSLLKIPFILGATSNGLSINSNGVAVSGTVYVDDGYLGAQDVKQEVTNIGPWTSYTPTWTVVSGTNPAIGNGTITGKWRQVGDSIEVTFNISSGSTTTYGAGIYVVSLPPGLTIDTSKSSDDYGTSNMYINSGGFQTYIGKVIGNTPTSIRFIGTGVSLWSSTVPVTLTASTAGHSFSGNFTVPVTQFSGSTSTYSSPSDSFSTDSNVLTHKTTAITSSDAVGTYNTFSYAANTNTRTICATPPSVLPTSADGFKIFTRAFNVASTCGNPARVEIKIGVAGTKFPTLKTDIYKSVGKSVSGNNDYTLLSLSAERGLTINSHDETTGVLTIDAGVASGAGITYHDFLFSDTSAQFSGYLVINAQKSKDSIVGSFDSIEKCTDSYECSETFSATVSGNGVVVSGSENIDWISGNCTATNGAISCSYKTGLNGNGVGLNSGLNCSIIPFDSDNGNVVASKLLSSSSTGLSWVSAFSGTKVGALVSVVCQKSGADYIGKTAKAVASDQNVRSIGAVGVDIQSVYFGSGADCTSACTTGTCTICNQVGSKITSVSHSGVVGLYNINGIDGTKYNCQGSGIEPGVSMVSSLHNRATSTSSIAKIGYGSGTTDRNVGYASVTCIGIPQ